MHDLLKKILEALTCVLKELAFQLYLVVVQGEFFLVMGRTSINSDYFTMQADQLPHSALEAASDIQPAEVARAFE